MYSPCATGTFPPQSRRAGAPMKYSIWALFTPRHGVGLAHDDGKTPRQIRDQNDRG